MPAPLSDSFPYITMPVFPQTVARVLTALNAAPLGPPRLHAKCFYECLSRSDTICHGLSWFCLSRAAPSRVRPQRSASPKPPIVP
ncbi:unnamed protein product [Musa acuminata subsp. burmannicoides]